MSAFFVMECGGNAPVARVELMSEPEDSPWASGAMVRAPEERVRYGVHPRRRGNLKAMYELSVPLMRQDLAQALRDGGVDNLQVFDAVVQDPASGIERTDYCAFNVIGLISAADMRRSELMHDESVSGLDHDFASLVLDEARIPPDVLLFRLAESTNAIVVHATIRALIEARRIEGMIFYESGEWSG